MLANRPITRPPGAESTVATHTDDIRLALQLEAADQLYTTDLLANPALLAAGLDSHYALRDHIRHIGHAFGWLANTPDARLLVMTPPQVGKTTAVEWGVLWWLATHPRDRVVIGSYNRDLAAKAGGHIRELITRYGAKFDMTLDPSARSRQNFSLTSGSGVLAVGVGSGLTGNPAHLAVIDDPHKDRAEAESVRIRDSVWDWYSSVMLSRFQPGTRLILVLTRCHEDDLAGRLLAHDGRIDDGGAWRVLHMPAIADPTLTPRGDPLGRAPGDPLPHPGIDEGDTAKLADFWSKRRAQTPSARDWASLYQGDPKPPEGALVTATLLRSIRELDHAQRPGAIRTAVAVDPAGDGRDTVGIVAGYRGTDERLWITRDSSGVIPVDTWPRTVCQLAYDVAADVIVYEANYGSAMPERLITLAWDALQREGRIPGEEMQPYVQKVHARQSKRLRAEPVAQAMHEDNVRLAVYSPELETEWCSWMPTDPYSPGRIDASVYLGRLLLPRPGARTGITPVDMLSFDDPDPADPIGIMGTLDFGHANLS